MGEERRDDEERPADVGVGVKERDEQRTQKPPMYRVVILNDDYTPMDFVIVLVQYVFRKTAEDATRIMLEVHQKGVAVAGIYTHEIAETKVVQAQMYARRAQHPLMVTMEPEE